MTQEERGVNSYPAWQRCLGEDTAGGFPSWVLESAVIECKEIRKDNQLCVLHGEQGLGTSCSWEGWLRKEEKEAESGSALGNCGNGSEVFRSNRNGHV